MRSAKERFHEWLEVPSAVGFKNRTEIISEQIGVSRNGATSWANASGARREIEGPCETCISVKFGFDPYEVININGDSTTAAIQ